MVGDVIFERGFYKEVVLAESDGIQLVGCYEKGINRRLYRLDPAGGPVASDLETSVSLFNQAVLEQRLERSVATGVPFNPFEVKIQQFVDFETGHVLLRLLTKEEFLLDLSTSFLDCEILNEA